VPAPPEALASPAVASRERLRGEWIAASVEGNPYVGRPLRPRLSLTGPTLEGYAAAAAGLPRWAERLKEIELLRDEHRARLGEARRALRAECRGDRERFARRWRALVAAWDFGDVNALVDAHNRYFPIERQLPFDLERWDYVDRNGEPFRREPLEVAWALADFPPEADAA
jgi:hypothetical protein